MRFIRTFLLFAALFFALGASAQERILNYDVTIEIQKNADLIVTENITVNSEGRSIKRGIFRDLPRYKLDDDDTIPYQYKILSVTKNGKAEPFVNSSDGNAKRVRIGDADVFLENGEYIYEIIYRVKNEIRYGETYDELYWNAIGRFWKFRIENASVTIKLPDGTPSNSIQDINSYVGDFSPDDPVAKMTRISSRADPIVVELLGYISGNSGFTVSVVFNKGIVDLPSVGDKTMLWWFKNGALFLLAFGFVGLITYYYRTWNKVGRDPDKLPVYPRYEPPKGYSAGAINQIVHKLVKGNDALIATLMSLAVKGAVHIDSQKKSTTLKYLGTEMLSAPLLGDEEYLLQKLFKKKKQIILKGKPNRDFTRAHTAFTNRIIRDYSEGYFLWNAKHTVLGIFLSLVAFFLAASQIYGPWKDAFIFIFIALVAMNLVFMFIMPAPTQKGAKVTAEIEGFKLYLETAESNRFAKQVSNNVAKAPPTMTQELYERYLPYAVALDVEKPWSKYFESMLPEIAENYNPAWGDTHSSRGKASRFTKSLSSNLSSGVSSARPQSSGNSRSGGGGGGSSGGGGGGGGGGGW